MLDRGRISSVQLVMLLYMIEMITAAIFLPARIVQLAGRDAWLAAIAGPLLYGLLVAAVALALAGRFPTRVFTEYLPEIIGKVPGKLLAAVYTAAFIHVTTLILNEGTSLTHFVYLPLTPGVVIDVVWVLVAVYGAYLGIEVIARENQLVVLVWLIAQFLILGLLAYNIDTGNLRPVLENGLLPVISGGIAPSAWRGELFLMLMLYPYLNQKHEAWPAVLWYMVLITISWFLLMCGIIGVFGAPVLARFIFPYLSFMQYESVAGFIERLDSLFVAIWIAGVLIKLAVFIHSSGIAAASTLGLKSYRATLLPIAAAAVILSRIWYGSYLRITHFLFHAWPVEAVIIELAIPALVLLTAVIRGKGGGRLEQQPDS
jgi:spore germination protein KB